MYREQEEMAAKVSAELGEPLGLEVPKVQILSSGGRKILRVFIRRKDGPTGIRDCENLSRILSRKMDEMDMIRGRYYLEVSSMGIEPEKKPRRRKTCTGEQEAGM